MRYLTSEVHGARPGASKTVVVLVTDVSTDLVDAAAAAARSNREFVRDSPLLEWGLGDGKWVKVAFLGALK